MPSLMLLDVQLITLAFQSYARTLRVNAPETQMADKITLVGRKCLEAVAAVPLPGTRWSSRSRMTRPTDPIMWCAADGRTFRRPISPSASTPSSRPPLYDGKCLVIIEEVLGASPIKRNDALDIRYLRSEAGRLDLQGNRAQRAALDQAAAATGRARADRLPETFYGMLGPSNARPGFLRSRRTASTRTRSCRLWRGLKRRHQLTPSLSPPAPNNTYLTLPTGDRTPSHVAQH